jgi:hypothetical protein
MAILQSLSSVFRRRPKGPCLAACPRRAMPRLEILETRDLLSGLLEGAGIPAFFMHSPFAQTMAQALSRGDGSDNPIPAHTPPPPYDLEGRRDAERWEAVAFPTPLDSLRAETDDFAALRPDRIKPMAERDGDDSPTSMANPNLPGSAAADASVTPAPAMADRQPPAADAAQPIWVGTDNVRSTPGFLGGAWVALQGEFNAVGQDVSGERLTDDVPARLHTGTVVDNPTLLLAGPWLADLQTPAHAVGASAALPGFEQFVGQMESWSHDLQASVVSILHSPWLVSAIGVFATVVVLRMSTQRGQTVPEVPEITSPSGLA